VTTEQMQRSNNKLDALTLHLQGFTAQQIANRFGVSKVTAALWIRDTKEVEKMMKAAWKRVEIAKGKLESDL